MQKRAVFLDRDGTINVEKNYLHKIEDWEWTHRAVEAIKLINEAGYLAIVVSNQAGVARGYYTEKDVEFLHQQVDVMLAQHGAHIDAYYYCPHHTEVGEIRDCECRKPKPGLLIQARQDWNIDFEKSFMIGDKLIDAEAAMRVGVASVVVMTGYGEAESTMVSKQTKFCENLYEAVNTILNNKAKNGI